MISERGGSWILDIDEQVKLTGGAKGGVKKYNRNEAALLKICEPQAIRTLEKMLRTLEERRDRPQDIEYTRRQLERLKEKATTLASVSPQRSAFDQPIILIGENTDQDPPKPGGGRPAADMARNGIATFNRRVKGVTSKSRPDIVGDASSLQTTVASEASNLGQAAQALTAGASVVGGLAVKYLWPFGTTQPGMN